MLTGSVPTVFFHLIDLGFNCLSGTISTEFQNVNQILRDILNNKNFLTGTISVLFVANDL